MRSACWTCWTGSGRPATVATAGGRFFGFVNGAALPASVAATWLASAWDQNAALRVMSPAAAALEDVALGWVRDVLGLPPECGGAVVTGATMANFTGLAAARHALLERGGWDVENDGLFGAPRLTVVVGEEVHASLLKALGLLGLGRKRVIRVPADEQGRMRAERMPALDDRTIVCIQAGNVNSGAFDPAAAICRRARRGGRVGPRGWRVRTVGGGIAAVSPPDRRIRTGGFLGDRWSQVAERRLRLRNRDRARMRPPCGQPWRSRRLTSRRENCASHRNYTPEMSRRARGVELWATLRSLGRRGLAELIERTCRHARRFADGLRAAGHEILNEVVINQVLVSFGEPAVTRAVIAKVQADGTCWCGGTEWHGRPAMRISVSSWATTEEDVELSLAAICRIAEECRR